MRIFENMQPVKPSAILVESRSLLSVYLEREVVVDFYFPRPVANPSEMSLLLINDGQNLDELGLAKILHELHTANVISPLFCAGIHTGLQRKMEYGVSGKADYMGRGGRAAAYTQFVLKELLPYIYATYSIKSFREKAFAGFSLGALMALDIVWNNADTFSKAGLFSGSFWWRSVDQSEEHYDDDLHRIIHQEIRKGKYQSGLKFFFQCGNMDETMDRNNNGIIDSIDDTLDLITELERKGYNKQKDIFYLEMADGRHDISTWARAMPVFLKWGWGK
jgi:enterochelin esterase-like enzyme